MMIEHCDFFLKPQRRSFVWQNAKYQNKSLPRSLGKHDFTKRHGQQNIKPAQIQWKESHSGKPIEPGHLYFVSFPLKIVIFRSYGRLPEGSDWIGDKTG